VTCGCVQLWYCDQLITVDKLMVVCIFSYRYVSALMQYGSVYNVCVFLLRSKASLTSQHVSYLISLIGRRIKKKAVADMRQSVDYQPGRLSVDP